MARKWFLLLATPGYGDLDMLLPVQLIYCEFVSACVPTKLYLLTDEQSIAPERKWKDQALPER